LDGDVYVDFLGEFTAGIYGHSNELIGMAVSEAMKKGWNYGGPNQYERELARKVCLSMCYLIFYSRSEQVAAFKFKHWFIHFHRGSGRVFCLKFKLMRESIYLSSQSFKLSVRLGVLILSSDLPFLFAKTHLCHHT
jgi:4-aminobutyrate aminotransferase-like enzyme